MIFDKALYIKKIFSSLKNRFTFFFLQELDVEENPIALTTVLVVLALYLIMLFFARRKDADEESKEHLISFIGSEDSFYHYEIRVKTGMYPYSGNFCSTSLIARLSQRV